MNTQTPPKNEASVRIPFHVAIIGGIAGYIATPLTGGGQL